ncbi:MAG TPA: C4-type zinc ribbon domain-containing protein [Verrucomicrobiae bacterium]|nr:C4-type zinc ribbon domain-containing protein [Verrucomicrobiae bacterium]
MNATIQNLLKLQLIEFGDEKGTNKQIADLRAAIPEPILGHYDRLRARDKKGVAVVRNQVCAGCHMRLPIGVITTLMQDRDIQLCDSCGRYLYLELQEAPVEPVAPVKPVKKRRSKAVAA